MADEAPQRNVVRRGLEALLKAVGGHGVNLCKEAMWGRTALGQRCEGEGGAWAGLLHLNLRAHPPLATRKGASSSGRPATMDILFLCCCSSFLLLSLHGHC